MLFACNAISGQVRKDVMHGREHLVTPVIAIAGDSVLNEEFVPFAEVASGFGSWDNRPVTLGHPQRGNDYISANDPVTLESYEVGRLFRTRLEDDKLKGELWIDIALAQGSADGRELIRRLEAGERVEVSTGYWRDLEETSGVHNGKEYYGVARNLKPDHLAMLLRDRGACSWEDGCGAPRVNQGRDNVKVNILGEARTPSYNGTTDAEWSAPDLEDFNFGVETIEELTDEQRNQIASGSLLGDPGAETFSDLSFFPVVEPGGDLNQNALMAVISGRGQQADIPPETYASADTVARRLLQEEFDMEGESENVNVNALLRVLRFFGIGGSNHAVTANQGDGDSDIQRGDNMQVQDFLALGEEHGVRFNESEIASLSELPYETVNKITALIEALVDAGAQMPDDVPVSDPPARERPASEQPIGNRKLSAAVEKAGGPEAASVLIDNVLAQREEQRQAWIETIRANVELEDSEVGSMSDAALEKLAEKFSTNRSADYRARGMPNPVSNATGVHEYKRPGREESE